MQSCDAGERAKGTKVDQHGVCSLTYLAQQKSGGTNISYATSLVKIPYLDGNDVDMPACQERRDLDYI